MQELNTLEQKREFFIGKELYSEGENLGKISKLLYSKIKDEYTLVIDEPLVLDEDLLQIKATEFELKSLSEKSGNIREYYIDELQEKEPEENISISKEALEYLAKHWNKSEEETLKELETASRSFVNEIISDNKDNLQLTEYESNGDILIDIIKITPVEVLKNSPDFKYYALTPENKIVFGAEYKEDVREYISDRKQYTKLRLVSKRDLPVEDVNDNSNWIEDSSEKISLIERMLKWYHKEVEELSKEQIVSEIIKDSRENVYVYADNNKEELLKIVTIYGDAILEKANCSKKYLMTNTEKALRDEYKKLEMFY